MCQVEKLKAGAVIKAKNLGEFYVKIIKHDPSAELAIVKTVLDTTFFDPLDSRSSKGFWRRAEYCIVLATDNKDVIAKNQNFVKVGDRTRDKNYVTKIFENLVEELSRARTSMTELAYGDNKKAFPPENLTAAYTLFKGAVKKADR
jgi:hypothetical protein